MFFFWNLPSKIDLDKREEGSWRGLHDVDSTHEIATTRQELSSFSFVFSSFFPTVSQFRMTPQISCTMSLSWGSSSCFSSSQPINNPHSFIVQRRAPGLFLMMFVVHPLVRDPALGVVFGVGVHPGGPMVPSDHELCAFLRSYGIGSSCFFFRRWRIRLPLCTASRRWRR